VTPDKGDGDAERGRREGLSRRTILSGIGTIGGLGAVGGGALAVTFDDDDESANATQVFQNTSGSVLSGGFWDQESWGAVNPNVFEAGELDLTTCWEQPGETCDPTTDTSTLTLDTLSNGEIQQATLRCALSDNPAWLWLRTSCPADGCGLERGIDLTVWYDKQCDGSVDSGQVIASGRLCDVLTTLREGVLLDRDLSSEEPDPLRPGDTCCLGFEFSVGDLCVVDEDSLTIDIDLYAEQRRHQPDPTRPAGWGDDCTVDCGTDCPSCEYQGISFVAFCIEDGRISPGDISFTPHYDADGEPYRIDWSSDVAPEWVVLYYGSSEGKYFENFHYDGQSTTGSVHVNTANDDTPSNSNYDSKLRWHGGQDATADGQCPRDPCPNPSEDDESGCGVKFEFDDDTWEAVCGSTCGGEK